MTTSPRRRRRVGSALAAALLLAAAPAAAQQTGTVSGQVTASGGGQPLGGVQVGVVGTNFSVVTNAQGRYTLRAPARAVTVRAIRLGYSEQARSVTVPAGGNATADFALHEVAVALAPVVTTATG